MKANNDEIWSDVLRLSPEIKSSIMGKRFLEKTISDQTILLEAM